MDDSRRALERGGRGRLRERLVPRVRLGPVRKRNGRATGVPRQCDRDVRAGDQCLADGIADQAGGAGYDDSCDGLTVSRRATSQLFETPSESIGRS
jgi:hypothetical protein